VPKYSAPALPPPISEKPRIQTGLATFTVTVGVPPMTEFHHFSFAVPLKAGLVMRQYKTARPIVTILRIGVMLMKMLKDLYAATMRRLNTGIHVFSRRTVAAKKPSNIFISIIPMRSIVTIGRAVLYCLITSPAFSGTANEKW
jgi:hypothetical protein